MREKERIVVKSLKMKNFIVNETKKKKKRKQFCYVKKTLNDVHDNFTLCNTDVTSQYSEISFFIQRDSSMHQQYTIFHTEKYEALCQTGKESLFPHLLFLPSPRSSGFYIYIFQRLPKSPSEILKYLPET